MSILALATEAAFWLSCISIVGALVAGLIEGVNSDI